MMEHNLFMSKLGTQQVTTLRAELHGMTVLQRPGME